MRIGLLERSRLTEAAAVLAASCVFDRADVVAAEKLFGPGPSSVPQALGAWVGEALVGVAAVAGNRVRVLAVVPAARRQGVGTALLEACVVAVREGGASTLRTLDQPGNYLAPGVDERNVEAIGWLERRGWQRHGELRSNVRIDVRGNARVSVERAEALAALARTRGYEVRR
ncbi:MAG: GNAT family N-acetyltransferase, partial [Myxococcales bacterium]|nr:GNAT family N-acetyltransferase [Myxococcales bacterium]